MIKTETESFALWAGFRFQRQKIRLMADGTDQTARSGKEARFHFFGARVTTPEREEKLLEIMVSGWMLDRLKFPSICWAWDKVEVGNRIGA